MGRSEGSSVIIYHADKFDIKKEAKLPLQSDMTEIVDGTGTLIRSYTKIKKKESSRLYDSYSVEQYTNTINEPIRFYWEGIRDFNHGYQRFLTFEVIYRKSDSKLFVFANGEHTELFRGRLKELEKNGVVKLDGAEFDFTKIRSVDGIKNIGGVWEKAFEAHKSAFALFGIDADMNTEVNLRNTTALNIKIEIDKTLYAMTLSKDGRVSSSTKLKHDELIEIIDARFMPILKKP